MNLFTRVIVFFSIFLVAENNIYLYNTQDGLSVEYYDCVTVESLSYCRRPEEPINLTRDSDTLACQNNGGKLRHFPELKSTQDQLSEILHQWNSSIERVEDFSRYLSRPSPPNGSLCQCVQASSFGKNCEYQLPFGTTFDETLQWQLTMRKADPYKAYMHKDIVCYDTLKCDSGLLCLDWREVCDGVQQCMSGSDEENCDLLEMNICEADEYRCMNGMCIPDEYFLDGEFDCLDWSDELQYKKSVECGTEAASVQCDDHLCLPNEWSCGDGECISD